MSLASIYYSSSAIARKIKAANTPERRKIRAQKRQQRIIEAKNDATISLLFLWVVSPTLVAVLLATTTGDFTKDYQQTYILAVEPFLAGLIALFTIGTKGQDTR